MRQNVHSDDSKQASTSQDLSYTIAERNLTVLSDYFEGFLSHDKVTSRIFLFSFNAIVISKNISSIAKEVNRIKSKSGNIAFPGNYTTQSVIFL